MTLTIADIERWDAGDVREVFHAATSRAQAVQDAANGIAELPAFATWGGEAAEAAKDAIAKTRADLDAHGAEALAIASAARTAADEIERLRSDLATLKANAAALGLEIDPPSGRVVADPVLQGHPDGTAAQTTAAATAGRPDDSTRHTSLPLTAPIVGADPKIVQRQLAKVEAAQQNVAAAQAGLDDAASEVYTQGAGAGPNRNVTELLTQKLFDARRELADQTKILEDLNLAVVESVATPVEVPPLPPNADVQSLPPEPSKLAEASRALSEGSFGIIPDYVETADVLTNWGEHSGAEQTGALLDIAGSVPLPGGKLVTEGVEHGLDALGVFGRHSDDIPTDVPTPHGGADDMPSSPPDVPNVPDAPNVDAPDVDVPGSAADDIALEYAAPPPMIQGPGGEVLPLVPENAIGSVVNNGKGLMFDIPAGTEGLDPRVVGVRVMDPVDSGPYPYPYGYVVYQNAAGQAVNPVTGSTVGRSDPYWHIPLQ